MVELVDTQVLGTCASLRGVHCKINNLDSIFSLKILFGDTQATLYVKKGVNNGNDNEKKSWLGSKNKT